jgi:hypothetical protein
MENGNMLADSQSVWNRWKNFFNWGLNVHGVHNVRQKYIHMAIGKLKSYKSLGTDQIPAELIKAGSEILCSEVQKLICSIWNMEVLQQQWKKFIIIPIHKKDNKNVIIIEESPSYQLPTKFYPTFFWPG